MLNLIFAKLLVQVSFSAKQASAAGPSTSMSSKEWALTLLQLLLLVSVAQLLLLGLDLLLPPGQVCCPLLSLHAVGTECVLPDWCTSPTKASHVHQLLDMVAQVSLHDLLSQLIGAHALLFLDPQMSSQPPDSNWRIILNYIWFYAISLIQDSNLGGLGAPLTGQFSCKRAA